VAQAQDNTVKPKGEYTTGSIPQHILKTTVLAALGLVSLFLVDLVDIYFISLLGDAELTAAVGFGASVMFFTTSFAIAGMITAVTLLSRRIGAGDMAGTQTFFAHANLVSFALAIGLVIGLFVFAEPILGFVGASGPVLDHALSYFVILIWSFPFTMVAMNGAAALRANGDFRRAMYVELAAGLVNAVLDPLFIFGFGWGIEGAAWASFASRVMLFAGAFYLVARHYDLRLEARMRGFFNSLRSYSGVFAPTLLGNLAAPLGGAFVVSQLAQFGPEIVAGMTVIERLLPVLFIGILALSGAINPIIGQNFGASNLARVRQTIRAALWIAVLYVAVISALMAGFGTGVVALFGLTGDAADIAGFYLTNLTGFYLFVAICMVIVSALTNIGSPVLAMLVSALRGAVFLIPATYAGAQLYGAQGVLLGQVFSAVAASAVGYLLLRQRVGVFGRTGLVTREIQT